jgi:hypothetical protein
VSRIGGGELVPEGVTDKWWRIAALVAVVFLAAVVAAESGVYASGEDRGALLANAFAGGLAAGVSSLVSNLHCAAVGAIAGVPSRGIERFFAELAGVFVALVAVAPVAGVFFGEGDLLSGAIRYDPAPHMRNDCRAQFMRPRAEHFNQLIHESFSRRLPLL